MVCIIRKTYSCGCTIGRRENESYEIWTEDKNIDVNRKCYKHLHPEKWRLVGKKDGGGYNYEEWEKIR